MNRRGGDGGEGAAGVTAIVVVAAAFAASAMVLDRTPCRGSGFGLLLMRTIETRTGFKSTNARLLLILKDCGQS
jgi:hypothetical protein